ncbi:hypothetical protein PENSPDRAFT_681765 [Peniophora sp. CONT]|nr:hypothetical protein PENSPDRAFT_681765 [Peniophora sp. CONT]
MSALDPVEHENSRSGLLDSDSLASVFDHSAYLRRVNQHILEITRQRDEYAQEREELLQHNWELITALNVANGKVDLLQQTLRDFYAPFLPLNNLRQLTSLHTIPSTSAAGPTHPFNIHEPSTETTAIATAFMHEDDDSSDYEYFNHLTRIDDEAPDHTGAGAELMNRYCSPTSSELVSEIGGGSSPVSQPTTVTAYDPNSDDEVSSSNGYGLRTPRSCTPHMDRSQARVE